MAQEDFAADVTRQLEDAAIRRTLAHKPLTGREAEAQRRDQLQKLTNTIVKTLGYKYEEAENRAISCLQDKEQMALLAEELDAADPQA